MSCLDPKHLAPSEDEVGDVSRIIEILNPFRRRSMVKPNAFVRLVVPDEQPQPPTITYPVVPCECPAQRVEDIMHMSAGWGHDQYDLKVGWRDVAPACVVEAARYRTDATSLWYLRLNLLISEVFTAPPAPRLVALAQVGSSIEGMVLDIGWVMDIVIHGRLDTMRTEIDVIFNHARLLKPAAI